MQQTAFLPNTPRLAEMPLRERPIERLTHFGAGAVSLTELLAALVGGQHQMEIAHTLITRHKTVTAIAQAPLCQLEKIKHLGRNGAARLKAALELGRRLSTDRSYDNPQITGPADGANLVMAEMSALRQEEVRVLILNTRNRVIATETIYKGSLNTNVVRVAELFYPAIQHSACAIIIVHNHPSGEPTPSPEDVKLTEMLVQAGKLLDIEVLDHLIIGQGRFVSLKERGLGFR